MGLNKRNYLSSPDGKYTSTASPRTPKPPTPKTQIAPPATTETFFSQQEILELKESFRLFDLDETGSISVESFRSVLVSLLEDKERSYPHLEEILRLLSDRSDSETLDFDGYLALMANTSLQQRLQVDGGDDEQPNFQHVFDLFDVDGKGYITVEDLRRVALELGENDMTIEELQEMIDRARSRKTGQVTLKEFSKMMTLNLFQQAEHAEQYQEEAAPDQQD